MKSLSIEPIRSLRHGVRLDFHVSGRPLLPVFERLDYDLVPRLGSGRVPVDVETRALLLCDAPGDLPSGRVALYVCPLYGDHGCGTISTLIERERDAIVWRDFAGENNIDDELHLIEWLGPFRFALSDYEKALHTPPNHTKPRQI